MDPILVERRPYEETMRLVSRYASPSLRLRAASAQQPTQEALVNVREALSSTLGRPPSADELLQLTVLPEQYSVRPFGDAHDFIYDKRNLGIVEVDFLVPEETWAIVDPFPEWPATMQRVGLALARETAEADGDELGDVPVVVRTNPGRTHVLIDLDYVEGVGEAVELSDESIAVLNGRRLVALFARLA